jgi:putative transcriptional regulator
LLDRQPQGPRLRNRLKVYRARFDLTQEQLAERALVTRKTINTIERGHYVPSTTLALKLARVLETTVEELFQLPTVESRE